MSHERVLTLSQSGNRCSCILGYNAVLMCPKCYELYNINQVGTIFANTGINIDLLVSVKYSIQCKTCGYRVSPITLDPPIASAVSILNRCGYKTNMSCGGHNGDKINTAFIKFDETPKFITLPELWSIKDLFLRADTVHHEEAIESLNRWVKKLKYGVRYGNDNIE